MLIIARLQGSLSTFKLYPYEFVEFERRPRSAGNASSLTTYLL
jgi:hypothetical protein